MNAPEGHRERLRQKFKRKSPFIIRRRETELLLTYAIPRKDVEPLAHGLLAHFGSLQAVIVAPPEQLLEIDGVGESTITFIQLLQSLMIAFSEVSSDMSSTKRKINSPQLNLFKVEPEFGKPSSTGNSARKKPAIKDRQMRVFANDEIVNSLAFLPQAGKFRSLEDFKGYLQEKLPYNAAETRQRRANYIIERFYFENNIDTPFTYFVSQCTADVDLKPVIFYHILKAEPIATKVAEEFIWPALPIGRIEREQLREFVLQHLPNTKVASQAKILQAIFHTYGLLDIGETNTTTLRFQLHKGTMKVFSTFFQANFLNLE
jgi:DNA repair protein RadC